MQAADAMPCRKRASGLRKAAPLQARLYVNPPMPTARLADRALVSVAGPDAEHFLQNLLTIDLDGLGHAEAKPGALLTPQGKIAFDFLISRDGGDAFLMECRAGTEDDFLRRLALYRLRAQVEISKLDPRLVAVWWSEESGSPEAAGPSAPPCRPDPSASALRDRRFPLIEVFRSYCEGVKGTAAGAEAWRALRIRHGVAESGDDYAPNDAFPHDVLLDQFGGVGFRKGCYVGQEVVSRMQHRGTARRRVLILTAADDLPAPGTEITAGGRALGALGSVSGASGLAILRIDRVKEALDSSVEIRAGSVPVRVAIPAFATFTLPAAGSEGT